ncbi:MAG: DUF1080 domain-containing protein [Bryobacterales bacterium]|nr:DUF1080 domain-containing protein [Bryobacterales bacterium]
MREPLISRRAFAAGLAVAPLAGQQDGWVSLFNGRNLDGWRAAEGPNSWKVVDGQLAADGPRSHLFYAGPVRNAGFKNFELEVEARALAGANSGVYFHTAYQEKDWPNQGFEVQINNSQASERKKTGSLYNLRNTYKQFVRDGEWFKLDIAVRGKRVQVRLNGMPLVDYVEPVPAYIPPGMEKARRLGSGTFALQCHDPGSKVFYRSVRVLPLPDDLATPGGENVAADDVFRRIIDLGVRGYPMADLHVHLKSGFNLEQAIAKSQRDGLMYGIAENCGVGNAVTDDAGARAFVERLRGQPVFTAMQAEGREWTGMFSRSVVALFDYVFTDSMTWTDNRGRRMRTWIPREVGTIADAQEFMDTLVDRAVAILEQEPIDIYVNPTFLPDQLAKDYETLWTEARRKRIVTAAAANGVAIEINDRYKLPSPSFIQMMKAGGCKFTFGTNNAGAADMGRDEYGLRMIDECKLTSQDFWVPLAPGSTKAVDRKGGMLKNA